MVLQVVRTSVFLVAPLSVSKVLFHCFEMASKPTYKHLLFMGSSKSPYINQCSIKDHTTKRNSFSIGLPPFFLVDQSHSFEERSRKGIEPLRKKPPPIMPCIVSSSQKLIQQFGHSNKRSNQKYPASLKQFSVQENYNTPRYRTPQPIPLANYERIPFTTCW